MQAILRFVMIILVPPQVKPLQSSSFLGLGPSAADPLLQVGDGPKAIFPGSRQLVDHLHGRLLPGEHALTNLPAVVPDNCQTDCVSEQSGTAQHGPNQQLPVLKSLAADDSKSIERA
jgi:hypothetical protein